MRCVVCDQPVTDGEVCPECAVSAPDPLSLDATRAPIVDVEEADSEVTRHLCCAAQSDEWFAQKLVSLVVRQPRRGIAMSPGVDIVAVLRHACSARRRRALRDLVLTVINLPAIILSLSCLVIAGMTVSLRPLQMIPPVLVVSLVVSTVVTFLYRLSYNHAITGSLHRRNFAASKAPQPRSSVLRNRIAEIERQAHGNITIYRGFKPFRGYGKVIGGWSFAIDITKPREPYKDCVLFDVHEIRDHVQRQVEALEWLGLRVEERIFVSGRDGQAFIDAGGRPRALVESDEVRQLLTKLDNRARPYTVIRLVGWDGELALTIFLRFVVVKRNLFIEASHSILTPLKDRFRGHDQLKRVEGWGYLWEALRSIRLFCRPMSAFPHLAERLDDMRALSEGTEAFEDPSFDHGVFFSIREWASDERYQRYFQKLDSEMYTKVVEQRIFDALVQFLDDHRIDTGELVQRQTTILNNGVMVTGNGSISAQNIAAGLGAQAGRGDQKGGGQQSGS
ncbi:hypothetical protein ACIBG7_24960 [Nonomuraea sp. NPDC050328]|uniref:hypothetical protein n=1 Tax=Nonomuraea sp. NPDC050328 TaxID=3364361 RepID=UPI0037B3EC1C